MTEYWSKTKELYTGYIDYPDMTDKLLKRPPFKYILSIFISVNKKTGFAEGLFDSKYLQKKFYDSPDKKIKFLKILFKFLYQVL